MELDGTFMLDDEEDKDAVMEGEVEMGGMMVAERGKWSKTITFGFWWVARSGSGG